MKLKNRFNLKPKKQFVKHNSIRKYRKQVFFLKVYLVDTENVASSWMSLLDIVEPHDKLYLFYTDYSTILTYSNLELILPRAKQIIPIHCERVGKNSLDFELVSYLGYLINEDNDAEYIIYSNDKGFQAVSLFWEKRNVLVRCMSVEKLTDTLVRQKTLEDNNQVESITDINNQVVSQLKANTLNIPDISNNKEITIQTNQKKYTFIRNIVLAVNELPKDYKTDKKFAEIPFPHQIKLIRNTYELFAGKISDFTEEQVIKVAVIVCFNREIADICNILPKLKIPIGPSIKVIKQNFGTIRKIINSYKKQKKKSSGRKDRINHAESLLLAQGLSPAQADVIAQMIIDTTSMDTLFTHLYRKFDAKTVNIVTAILPELLID